MTLQIKDDSITIPNSPIIEVKNTTSGEISISPCTDIKITIDSRPLGVMSGSAPDFCNTFEVKSGSISLLPMNKLYKVFAVKSGKYVVSLVGDFGERTIFFTVSDPG